MPRMRTLPVLLVLLALLGLDGLWSLRQAPVGYVPEPVVVHRSLLNGEQRYSGELRLPACAQLKSGISERGTPSQVLIDLSLSPVPGPCESSGTSQTFLLTYAGDGDFGGITVAGAPASYTLIEEQ